MFCSFALVLIEEQVCDVSCVAESPAIVPNQMRITILTRFTISNTILIKLYGTFLQQLILYVMVIGKTCRRLVENWDENSIRNSSLTFEYRVFSLLSTLIEMW